MKVEAKLSGGMDGNKKRAEKMEGELDNIKIHNIFAWRQFYKTHHSV